MNYFVLAMRGALLIISFCGYLCIFSKHVKVEFAPGLIFSCVGSLMFLAGIINVLQEMAWIICLVGVCFFFGSMKERRRMHEYMTCGILFFWFLAVFFLLLLFRSKFVHWDDFSHWGVVAKILAEKDYFPNLANTNVVFPAYPLGSTCFIYYITVIIGIAPEGLQAWAQALLMSGMVVSVFAFCRQRIDLFLAVTGSLMLLCSNTNFVDLLVDTLLPLTGFSALAFFIYYREEIEHKIFYAIPYVVFLVSIKNSGVLFAVFVLLYIFIHMEKSVDTLKSWTAVASSGAMVLFLWKKHVRQTFDSGATSKHSMTFENFKKVFEAKSGEEVGQISADFFETVFSLSNPFWILAGLCLLAWLLSRAYMRKRTPVAGELVSCIAISYMIYQIGMLGMYLFSMPGGEATRLAAYDRYHRTILIYIAALFLLEIIRVQPDQKQKIREAAVQLATVGLALVLMCSALTPKFQYYVRQNLESSDRGWARARMDSLIEEHHIKTGYRYLIVTNGERVDSDYLYYMTQYLLVPSQVSVRLVSDVKPDSLSEYDYIIMMEESDEVQSLVAEQTGVHGEPVIYLGSG